MLEEAPGPVIRLKGQDCVYFGGNNYLGLAHHPQVTEAAIHAIRQYGVNVAASRHTTGSTVLHTELEAALSAFKGKDQAVTFASGYLGNGILMQVLRRTYTRVLIDEAAHPSLFGGIPRDVDAVHPFRHGDVLDLEKLLQASAPGTSLMVTDGIYALTGEIAPLDEYHRLAVKYNAHMLVDDAHATGILGAQGRGTPEYFGLDGSLRIYQTETMSKAIGGYGGFIAGSAGLISRIREDSPVYQASTALPPPMAAAGMAGIEWIRQHPEAGHQLIHNALWIKSEIRDMGFQSNAFPTPIIPIGLANKEQAQNLSAFLLENGLWVPFMNYPVHQSGFLLRMALSLLHTGEHIDRLLTALKHWSRKEGLPVENTDA